MHKHTLLITIILFLTQLGLFLWVTLRPFTISPPGRTYSILRGQGAYTAFIRQAKDGAWNLYNSYTTRPSPAVYVHLMYVLLGKLAAILSADPVFVYMVTRILAGLTLFLVTYWCIGIVVPKNIRVFALLFSLGIEPGPLITAIKNIPSLVSAPPAIFSYFPQVLALRHFGLPHHVLAEALGLLIFGNAVLYMKKPSWVRLAGLGACALAGTLIMPAYNTILILTVFLPWGIWELVRGNLKRVILPFGVIVLAIGLAGLFTKYQMDTGYPWKDFNLDEKRWVTDGFLLTNYLSSLLLFLPAVMALFLALPHAFRHLDSFTKRLIFLMTSWVVGPMLLIPLTKYSFFPFANFRLIDGYAYVPMGILAAIGISVVVKKRLAIYTSALLILLASLILTVSYTRQIFLEQHNYWLNVYPLHDEWAGIRYLSTVPHGSGVLVMKYFGEIIPSYANVRVYLGETPGMVDWPERYYTAAAFYSGTLSESDARKMLTRENISYVWWDSTEKEFLRTRTLYPTILTPVYQTPNITIFEVDNTTPR